MHSSVSSRVEKLAMEHARVRSPSIAFRRPSGYVADEPDSC